MSTTKQASVTVPQDAVAQYVLRLGDTCLILGQRLGEWCGHAPVLEEDIAMSNMALDLIGQARALLTHAGVLAGQASGQPALSEDQLAFLREERDYRNPALVELPRGDFGFTVLRNAVVATWLVEVWTALAHSSDAELAAIAGKAVKEARYHQQHNADWVVRLGDGTPESTLRMQAAVNQLWRYLPELLEDDGVDLAAAQVGLGPKPSDLRDAVQTQLDALLREAGLSAPAATAFRSTGKRGVHTEHMGYLLAEMQHLHRSFPGGVW
jgi:ring-1,2-phenylacetyl-CoA epoxidase subunit PaaC